MRGRSLAAALAAAIVMIGLAACENPFSQVGEEGGLALLVGQSASERGSQAAIRDCAQKALDWGVEETKQIDIAQIALPSQLDWREVDARLDGAARSNSKEADAAKSEDRRDGRAAIDDLLTGIPPADASDYLGSTVAAAGRLEQSGAPSTLIVCGDAHHGGDGLDIDLYRQCFVAAECTKLVDEIPPELLARLGEVAVSFGAVGLDRGNEFPAKREAAIEAFWEAWATATRAQSFQYDVGLGLD